MLSTIKDPRYSRCEGQGFTAYITEYLKSPHSEAVKTFNIHTFHTFCPDKLLYLPPSLNQRARNKPMSVNVIG